MATNDGSALAGEDYSSLNAELSFNSANDQQLLCMNIGTIDDSSTEGNELFFVDITTNAAQVSVNPGRLTATIIDNDVLQPGIIYTNIVLNIIVPTPLIIKYWFLIM